MPKRPPHDTSPAEFISSRRRRLRSGSSIPCDIPLPPSRGRAQISPKNTVASSGNKSTFVASKDDPDYLVFLLHLRVDGRFYSLEMPAADGSASPLRCKYEEDDGTRSRAPPTSQQQKQRKRWSKSNKTSDHEPEKRQRTMSASAGSGVTCLSPSSGEGRFMYDEDYQMFLDQLRLREDGSMVVQWDNGVIVVYEEQNGNDDDVIVIGDEKSAKGSNVCIAEIDLVSCDDSPPRAPPAHEDIKHLMEILRSKMPSAFNDRLMSVLEKPFDEKEYDQLMIMATRRKPVMRLKHLREDSVPYETDIIGLSYLDHYPDLARQIQSTDKSMVLFLLRGFFFWLKNIGHVGAYKPWLATSSSFMSDTFLESKNVSNVKAKLPKHAL